MTKQLSYSAFDCDSMHVFLGHTHGAHVYKFKHSIQLQAKNIISDLICR